MITTHGAVSVKRFIFNPLQENTYLIYTSSLEAILIDPGCHSESEQNRLNSFIKERQLIVRYLLNTHCHFDHICGNLHAKDQYQAKLYLHQDGLFLLSDELEQQICAKAMRPDGLLIHEDFIQIEGCCLQVRLVPGHAPGHVVFYSSALAICFVGDTLFRGAIGRSDLPGGDQKLLIDKIKSQLLTLPDEVVVYPGHGPSTTIGAERFQPIFDEL